MKRPLQLVIVDALIRSIQAHPAHTAHCIGDCIDHTQLLLQAAPCGLRIGFARLQVLTDADIPAPGIDVLAGATPLYVDTSLRVVQPHMYCTVPEAERVHAAAAFDQAMMHAMNGLSRRAMSELEVKQKLKQKDHTEAVIAQVVSRLHELALLDDEAFGRALIRDLKNRQPAGPRLMKQKLAQKGLDSVLIDQLVDEALQASDPVEDALALAHKRLPRLQGLDAATRKRRLYGQLARRGFTPETLDQVMNQLADELRDDGDEPMD